MEAKLGAVAAPAGPLNERPEPVRTARQMIPGAYERDTLTYRPPSSTGGSAAGGVVTAAGPSLMDEDTARERRKEGGGRGRV